MEKTPLIYGKMLLDFKSQACRLIANNLPGHFKSSRALLNKFLKEKRLDIKNSYILLVTGLLSEDQFIRLFSGMKAAFSLKDLKNRGVPAEKIKELTRLIFNLLEDTMIIMGRIWKEDKAEARAKLKASTNPKEK